MKRLAIFVEGQTEQIFFKRLVEEIAGKQRLSVRLTSIDDVAKFSIRSLDEDDDKVFEVLIFDCRGDDRVKAAILERRERLESTGYHLIVGVRDLYPLSFDQIPAVLRGNAYQVPTAGVPIRIFLAVAEVEAWFLHDHSHFEKVDNRLNPATFHEAFGYDPLAGRAESVEHPSGLLHRIYQSVGKAYKKKEAQVDRTVQALDMEFLCCDEHPGMPHFSEMRDTVWNFFQ